MDTLLDPTNTDVDSKVATYAAWDIDEPQHKVLIKFPLIAADASRDLLAAAREELDNDVEAFGALRDLACVSQLVDHGIEAIATDRASLLVPFVVYEPADGQPLDQWLQTTFNTPFVGVPTAANFCGIALKLARAIREIHRRQVVHGHISVSNVFVSQGNVILVDFGQASLRKLVRQTAARGAGVPLTSESLDQYEEGAQRDIYRLGEILHFLATGVRYSAASDSRLGVRSAVFDTLKRTNGKLYRENSLIPEVIARCLYAPYYRAQNAEVVIQDLELCAHIDGSLPLPLAPLPHLPLPETPLFRRIAESRYRRFLEDLNDLRDDIYDVTADHHDLVDMLTLYLGSVRLERGDLYVTTTTPFFWDEENAEPFGRFLTANREAAKCGSVRRIFLLTHEDRDDRRIQQVIQSHLELMDEVGVDSAVDPLTDLHSPGYWAGCVLVGEHRRAELMRGEHFGVISVRDGRERYWTSLFPRYHRDDRGQLRLFGLRFRRINETEATKLLDQFVGLTANVVDLIDIVDDSDIVMTTGTSKVEPARKRDERTRGLYVVPSSRSVTPAIEATLRDAGRL